MDKKHRFTLHVNMDDFIPATDEEKSYIVQMRPSTTFFKDGVKRLCRNKVALVSLIVVAIITLSAILIPAFWPYSYDQQLGVRPGKTVDASFNNLAPFEYGKTELKRLEEGEKVFPHVFGTDSAGRDYFIRVVYGTRISLAVGFFASLIVLIIGMTVGSIAGYCGGKVDLIIMPIVAVVSLFNGGIEIDTDRLQTMVVENLSAEEQAKLQAVEDTMYAIEDAMLAAGFPARVKEAQVLYVLALSDFADDNGFVEKLVGCFTAEQTDAQLISAVNSAFGTSLAPEDFTQVMQAIRAVYIDTSHYTDPSTKNNLDLVQWAIAAEKAGWGYVWGTFGEVLTESYYEAKAAQYPDEVGGYEDFIRQNWLGGRTADCVGFIKGYGWLNSDTHEIEYGTNGMPDIGADAMYDNATEKGTIDTIPEIPGLAVWHEGHIGIYIGNGQVIHASGTKVGVVQTPIGSSGWTHWLKIPYITYIEETEEETP